MFHLQLRWSFPNKGSRGILELTISRQINVVTEKSNQLLPKSSLSKYSRLNSDGTYSTYDHNLWLTITAA